MCQLCSAIDFANEKYQGPDGEEGEVYVTTLLSDDEREHIVMCLLVSDSSIGDFLEAGMLLGIYANNIGFPLFAKQSEEFEEE